MDLTLTDSDIDIVTAQQAVLLGGRLDDEARVKGVLTALRRLIGAQRGFAAYLLGSELRFIKDGVGPQIETYLASVFQGFDRDGNMLMSDAQLAEINKRRRQMGAGVHHENRLQNRKIIEETAYFRQAFAPAGMHHVIGLTAPLPVGEAVFAFGFAGADDPGFSEPRAEHLLRLLLPAFEAGFQSAFRQAVAKEELEAALAALPGARLSMRRPSGSSPHDLALPGPALPEAEKTWIVISTNAAAEPLELAKAARANGLTDRQTEVMELMLKGHSSTEIAGTLGISAHTARRHCEAVLKRLGVKSRAAIWSVLAGTIGRQ